MGVLDCWMIKQSDKNKTSGLNDNIFENSKLKFIINITFYKKKLKLKLTNSFSSQIFKLLLLAMHLL